MPNARTDQTEPIFPRLPSGLSEGEGRLGRPFSSSRAALRPVAIGPYQTVNNLFVAPMAGVTDLPFRILCKSMGAGYAVSEMVASNSLLYGSIKTQRRADSTGEPGPIAIQLLGTDPAMLAEAAKHNVGLGAQIIDFNMGCPAKKVCNVMAGSALMRDETRVAKVLTALVAATEAPVTLKIRTGWDADRKNAVEIARIAEDCGVQLLSVHGRTRAAGYSGEAEYDTIAEIKSAISIPVIANGDIDSPEKAAWVLNHTSADGIMIGRAVQGYPWIFTEILHFLKTGERLPAPSLTSRFEVLKGHLRSIYDFYGEKTGVCIARKHICWYTKSMPASAAFRQAVNRIPEAQAQLAAVDAYRETLMAQLDQAA